MIWRLITFLVVILGVGAASAGKLPPIAFLSLGFREAQTADLSPVIQGVVRRTAKNDFLTVTTDFNGDGKTDEARILISNGRQLAIVIAVIKTAEKIDTFVLAQFPRKDVSNIGITEARPLPENASNGRFGISIISLKSGVGEANYFSNEDFNIRVPVSLAKNADT